MLHIKNIRTLTFAFLNENLNPSASKHRCFTPLCVAMIFFSHSQILLSRIIFHTFPFFNTAETRFAFSETSLFDCFPTVLAINWFFTLGLCILDDKFFHFSMITYMENAMQLCNATTMTSLTFITKRKFHRWKNWMLWML